MSQITNINIKGVPIIGILGALKYTNDDWSIEAFFIPRDKLNCQFNHDDFTRQSIYFLIGNEDGEERIYVGQAKIRNDKTGVIERLREHDISKTESYRDVWQYAIVFNSQHWQVGDLNALEYIFYEK